MNRLQAPEQIVKKLWDDVIKEGNCIVWIGSGLSYDIYPEWRKTVQQLCNNCQVDYPVVWANSSPDPDELLSKADECKNKDLAQYEATLAKLFGEEPTHDRREYRHLLATPQYRAFITTNFDRLLYENASDVRCNPIIQAYPILKAGQLGSSEQPCFYIHGLAFKDGIPSGKDLILAKSEFDVAYNSINGNIGITRLFILNILKDHPLIFLGCNLKEAYLKECFRMIHTIHRQHADIPIPPRYTVRPGRKLENLTEKERRAIFKEEKDEETRFREIGIKVLRYEAHDEKEFQLQTTIVRLLKERGLDNLKKIPPLESQEGPMQ